MDDCCSNRKSNRVNNLKLKVKCILWDFNGTLLDDVQICVDIMNAILKEQGKDVLTVDSYREIFTFPVIEDFRRAKILENDDDFEEIAHKWMDMYYRLEEKATIYDDTIETLEYFKQKEIPQGVLSASRIDQLERLLKQVGIASYMNPILGISDIYAKSKVHIGIEFMEKSHIDPSDVVMIGDSVHDFEVASAMNIHCILVARGHQSKKVLETCGCPVVDTMKDVCEYIERKEE